MTQNWVWNNENHHPLNKNVKNVPLFKSLGLGSYESFYLGKVYKFPNAF